MPRKRRHQRWPWSGSNHSPRCAPPARSSGLGRTRCRKYFGTMPTSPSVFFISEPASTTPENRMNTANSDNVRRVAFVGAGLIGSGWAAHFLARGLDVVATDPALGAEAALRRQVDRVWPILVKLGLQPGADRSRLTFSANLEAAVAEADFVQENGPE